MAEGRAGRSGQHFLDHVVARDLVRAAGVRSSDLVVDLGAGDGRLTSALLSPARHVIAVENDPRLAGVLRRRYGGAADVTVVCCDIERFRWPRERFRVVANPPFGLTTHLLRALLGDPAMPLTHLDLVLQSGAAIKRTKPTGHALNVSWQPWWSLRIARRIPRTSFRPPPPVDAAVLSARRREAPLLPTGEAEAFARFVAAGYRRGAGREASVEEWIRAFRRTRSRTRGQ